MDLVQASIQLGLPVALTIFFVLEGRRQSGKDREEWLAREKSMAERIDRLQCEMTETLEGVVKENSQVIRENAVVMAKVCDRLARQT